MLYMAFFCGRRILADEMNKSCETEKAKENALVKGLPLGVGIGVSLGVSLGIALDNLLVGFAIGTSMGISLSIVFGTALIQEKNKKEAKNNDENEAE